MTKNISENRLYINTASQKTKVGVFVFEESKAKKSAWLERETTMRHSEQIMSMIDEALDQADISKNELTTIYANIGPGSFTGLRVGITVANTLAYALQIPAIGVTGFDLITESFQISKELIMIPSIQDIVFIKETTPKEKTYNARLSQLKSEEWSSATIIMSEKSDQVHEFAKKTGAEIVDIKVDEKHVIESMKAKSSPIYAFKKHILIPLYIANPNITISKQKKP